MLRIAIIKPSALGDICHALPVLTALREAYPSAHISWIVNQSFEGLLKGHPHLDQTIPFDRGAFGKGLVAATKSAFEMSRLLRRQRFDWAIDLQGLLRTGLMTKATAARRMIGFANAREGARFAYNEAVEIADADQIHAVDRYWRIAEYLNAGMGVKKFIVPLNVGIQEKLRAEWEAYAKPWYAVAVGAKWLTKRWPTHQFAKLIQQAHKQFGGTVFFFGVKEDSELSQQVIQQMPGVANHAYDYCGKTDLPTLAAALALSDVMIANDTGPLHLAAALKVPCIAPYTCTKVRLHGPYTSMAGGIETNVACKGSYLKKCPNNLQCFEELTPDRLWPSLDKLLANKNN